MVIVMGIIEDKYKDYKRQNYTVFGKTFGYFIELMKEWCIEEHPTCEGCPFNKKYYGCLFRGKIPKEW